MYDVWVNYRELNADLKDWRCTDDQLLDNDKNYEDPELIVGVRKWSYENMPSTGPDWPLQLGYDLAEHVRLHDKYDLFIYSR